MLGLAAAAYNAGSGRIQKWLARQSDLPQETRAYVRIITGTRGEDWIEDSDMLAIRADLPRGARRIAPPLAFAAAHSGRRH